MKLVCPKCQIRLEVDASLAGNGINCPVCGQSLIAETAKPAETLAPSVQAEAPPSSISTSAQPQEPPKATPRFRIVFDPQTSGTSRAVPAFGGTAQPGSAAARKLSVKMPTVYWGITLASWFVGLLIPFLFSVSLIAGSLAIVSTATLHYKCWKALPAESARLTPGKAVGYLFIPFFGLYWAFPSLAGLGTACTQLARSNDIEDFDHLRPLGLAMAVLMCLSAVSIFVAKPLGVLAGLGQLVVGFFFYRDATVLLNGLSKTGIS